MEKALNKQSFGEVFTFYVFAIVMLTSRSWLERNFKVVHFGRKINEEFSVSG